MGVSVTLDYLLEELAVAEGSLQKKAEFIVKYCNVKQSSSQAFLNAVDVERAYTGVPVLPEQYAEHYAMLALTFQGLPTLLR